jgi:hypothetical protein
MVEFDRIIDDGMKWLAVNPDFMEKHAEEIKRYQKLLDEDSEFSSIVLASVRDHPRLLVSIVNLIEQEAKPSEKMLKSGGCK